MLRALDGCCRAPWLLYFAAVRVAGAPSRNSRSPAEPLRGDSSDDHGGGLGRSSPMVWCVGDLCLIFCCGHWGRASSRSRVLRHLEQRNGVDHRIFGESDPEEGISWLGMH